MRALVLYAHPMPDSFGAALHQRTVESLTAAGWEVDDCDLYAEGFSPVLTEAERRDYHEVGPNIDPVRSYVERLQAADALVLCFPVWTFGYPAILKGFFDRVFLPGVSFRIEDGLVRGNLTKITRLVAVTTYGGTRLRALGVLDPPRMIVTRALRFMVNPKAKLRYLALYDMNRATEARRTRFLTRVGREMESL